MHSGCLYSFIDQQFWTRRFCRERLLGNFIRNLRMAGISDSDPYILCGCISGFKPGQRACIHKDGGACCIFDRTCRIAGADRQSLPAGYDAFGIL